MRRNGGAHCAPPPHLSDEQRALVQRLTRNGDGVAVIVGSAGTGKTTAIGAAREAWEEWGTPVQGGAIARKAAHSSAARGGIRGHQRPALIRPHARSNPEPSSCSTRRACSAPSTFAELLARVDAARGKLVIAGDPSQLAAIEAGGMLGALARRLAAPSSSTTADREEGWEGDPLALLRDGDTDEALARYERHGRIHVGNDAHEMLSRFVADWHTTNDPDGCVMIARYRADVRELNGRARAVMRTAGRLGADELVAAGSRYATATASSSSTTAPASASTTESEASWKRRAPRRRPHRSHRRSRRRARRKVPRAANLRWPAHARARLRDDRPLRPGPPAATRSSSPATTPTANGPTPP